MGQEGFSSDSSLLYHRHLPTAIVAAEAYEPPAWTRPPNHPLKPRHLRTHKLDAGGADAVLGRQLPARQRRLPDLVRGRRRPRRCTATRSATSACTWKRQGPPRAVFGVLELTAGDYVIIPTSVIYRLGPCRQPVRTLIVEANGHIGPPKRYLSVRGQFLEHAPYCERDLRGPTEPLLVDGTDVEVYIQHRFGADVGPGKYVHAPSVRRGGLGRLPVPVGVLHPRLRADHRPGAPAAAGAPDLRGTQLRHLFVRAPQGRLPPAGDPGPLQPPQRGLGRGAVLHRRQL